VAGDPGPGSVARRLPAFAAYRLSHSLVAQSLPHSLAAQLLPHRRDVTHTGMTYLSDRILSTKVATMNDKPKPPPKPEPNQSQSVQTARQALQQSMDRRW
jgi:hypothetical protein